MPVLRENSAILTPLLQDSYFPQSSEWAYLSRSLFTNKVFWHYFLDSKKSTFMKNVWLVTQLKRKIGARNSVPENKSAMLTQIYYFFSYPLFTIPFWWKSFLNSKESLFTLLFKVLHTYLDTFWLILPLFL